MYGEEEGGIVDQKYVFSREAGLNFKLKAGDKVTCNARKLSEELPIVIYSIIAVDEEAWTAADEQELDDIAPSSSNPVPLQTYEKQLNGTIKVKMNGETAIDTTPKPIRMQISEIGCTFNPMVGDQVAIDAKFGISCDNPDEHTPIGYYGMKALETKTITGKITTFQKKQEYGLVDDTYIFFIDVLQHSANHSCMPNVGDTVHTMVLVGDKFVTA